MLGVAVLAFGVLLLLGEGSSPFASGYNRHGYDYGHYEQEQYYHDQEQHRQRRGAAFNGRSNIDSKITNPEFLVGKSKKILDPYPEFFYTHRKKNLNLCNSSN